MMSLNALRASTLACVVTIVSAAAYADEPHEWDYGEEHGPRVWAELKPEFAACGAGKVQSPINIRNAQPSKLAPIKFDYRPTALRIIDNGHTIQVNDGPGSSISVDGRRYELVQFHFHKPSEEKINGVRYPMVAHFVHKNADGALAVVAVLISSGGENALANTLWANLPPEKETQSAPAKLSITRPALLL